MTPLSHPPPPVRGQNQEVLLLKEPSLAKAVEKVKFKVGPVGSCPAEMLLTGTT